MNVGKLTGSFGFTAMTGWSMIEPISGIALCLVSTIFSFGGNKSSQNAYSTIIAEINKLREEMREYFGKVLENQRLIYNAIYDIKTTLVYRFDELNTNINWHGVILDEQHKEIYFKELPQLLFKAESHIKALRNDLYQSRTETGAKQTAGSLLNKRSKKYNEKLDNLLEDLYFWIIQKSSSPMANGSSYLRGSREPKYIINVLKNYGAVTTSLIGYVAELCKELVGLDSFPPPIETSKLFNIKIWSEFLMRFMNLIYLMNQGKLEIDIIGYSLAEIFNEIREQGENTLQFLHYLRSTPKLYQVLFDRYQQAIKEINQLIKSRFDEYRTSELTFNNGPSKLTVNDFIAQTTSRRDVLNEKLDEIDAIILLLKSYLTLAGLPINQLDGLLSKEKILKTTIHPFLIWSTIPKWNNIYRGEKYYKTLKTAVLTIDGTPKLYALIRSPNLILELYGYDYPSNEWMALAENKHTTWALQEQKFIDTFRTEIIKIDGEEKLAVLMWTPKHLEMHIYHPKTNLWEKLPDNGPLWKNEYNNHSYHRSFRTTVITLHGQQYLLAMLRSSAGLELYGYNPQQRVWQILNAGPLHHKIYSNEFSYSTLRVHTINVDGDKHQKLVALICNENGIDFYQCHFESNENKLDSKWIHAFTKPNVYGFANQGPYYYKTFKSNVITQNDGEQIIVMMMRDSVNLIPYAYNPNKNTFDEYGVFISMSNYHPYNYGNPELYETIRTTVVKVNQSDKLLTTYRYYQHGFLDMCLHDYETRSWINPGSLTSMKNDINLTPQKGVLLQPGRFDGDDYASYRALQCNILNVEGEKIFIGFTLAKDSPCCFGYVLTPKQFSLGDNIKNGLINLIQSSAKENLLSQTEEDIRSLLAHVKLLKVRLAQPEKTNVNKPSEFPGISSNPCSAKRRVGILMNHIRPEQRHYRFLQDHSFSQNRLQSIEDLEEQQLDSNTNKPTL